MPLGISDRNSAKLMYNVRDCCAVISNEKSNYDVAILYDRVYLSELYAKRNIEKNGLGPESKSFLLYKKQVHSKTFVVDRC